MRRALGILAAAGLAASLVVGTPARAAATCADPNHPGGEWRTFGNGNANSRNQPAETAIGPDQARNLVPRFTFKLSSIPGARGGFTGTPVIADGCLYVASDGGTVVALNADTGELVWSRQLNGGGINSTLAVQDGRVYGLVSRVGSPYAIALDQADGTLLWSVTLDDQPGSDTYASPVLFDGLVLAPVSGGSAELGDEADRYAFQGNYSLIEASTGVAYGPFYTVHPPVSKGGPDDDFAGATIWSTAAIDPAGKVAYVGTGNPFKPQAEHAHANAIVKIDMDRTSATFGQIVDSYKGDVDEFLPVLAETPCADIPGNPAPWYPQGGGACFDIDLDFGAAPNIFTGPRGTTLVGAGQKSGVYHAFELGSMEPEFKRPVGPPGAIGGIVGTATVDAFGIHGPITPAGYGWSIDKLNGALRWLTPYADGAHWGFQSSSANGVVYTTDLKGVLHATDAAVGVPLLARPIAAGSQASPTVSLGNGVSIARNTVYTNAGGFVVGWRP